MKLEREHYALEIQLAHASAPDLSHEEQVKMMRGYDMKQAAQELAVIGNIRGLFETGQMLMLASVILFALTLLPCQFYKRYQRSLIEYAD